MSSGEAGNELATHHELTAFSAISEQISKAELSKNPRLRAFEGRLDSLVVDYNRCLNAEEQADCAEIKAEFKRVSEAKNKAVLSLAEQAVLCARPAFGRSNFEIELKACLDQLKKNLANTFNV